MDKVQTYFSKVEYVTIFGTFIYGYVATKFLYGWGVIIQNRKELKFSKEHLLWTVFMFFMLLDIWWGSWLKGNNIAAHKLAFYLSMLSPLVLYLISVMYLPNLKIVQGDLKSYFETIRRVSFVLYFFLFISFFLSDFFLQKSPLLDFIVNGVGITLAVVGFVFSNRKINRIILALAFVALFFHIHSLRQYDMNEYFIENFSLSEYLNIFTAFIFGAVASNFFSGWGNLIHRYKEIAINREYLFWTLLAFGLLMDMWWEQWARSVAISKDFYTFLCSILGPFIFYFLSVVMFPKFSTSENLNLSEFYKMNKQVIMLMFGGILLSNFMVASIVDDVPFMTFTNLLRCTGTTLAISGVLVKNDKFHRLILILGWVMLISHSFKT